MPIKHAYQTAFTNDPSKEISSTRWNEAHSLDQYLDFPVQASDPATPAADLRVYSKSRGGRRLLNIIGPSGVDTSLQPGLFGNSVYLLTPGVGNSTVITGVQLTTTTSTYVGTQYSFIATGSTGAAFSSSSTSAPSSVFAATSALTRMQRMNFGTGTTATGQIVLFSSISTSAMRFLANTQTGFYYVTRFAIDTYQAALQIFCGLAPNNTMITTQPSANANYIGIAKDSTDSQWYFQIGGATPQRVATGVTCTAGQLLDFSMFLPPGGTSITFKLSNAETGATLADNTTISTGLPTSTVLLGARTSIRSTSGTTAKVLAVNKIYIETDI